MSSTDPQTPENPTADLDRPAEPSAAAPAPESAEPAAPKESLRERMLKSQQQTASQTQAVPSLEPTPPQPVATPPAAAPTEPAVAQDAPAEEAVAEAAAAQPDAPLPEVQHASGGPRGSVEIPSDEDLDAAMEAEIEAALASGELEAAGAAVAPPAAAEEAGAEAPEAVPTTEDELEQGAKLKGTVLSVDDDNVFVDLGFRSQGVVSLRQFGPDKRPAVGDAIAVRVEKYDPEEGLIHVSIPHGRQKVGGDFSAVQVGQIVDCVVNKTNKGGLEVTVGSLRGFMPAGQVDLAYHADLEPFVGRKLQAVVIEVNAAKKNLVVSHRSYLEMERQEQAATLWQRLEVGQTLSGTVKTIKDYGAFVDIGGADGFLHIGEMSWHHIKHPSEILKEGQQVEVKIVSLEPERSRIGLSLKALTEDPWMIAAVTYGVGTTVRGKVTRTAKFGAFVELEPGIEGLIHISELEHRRVNRVTEVLREGQTVDAQVLSVDPDSRRISLSLKALTAAPEPVRDEDLAPGAGEDYVRKRKGPLKGGIGGSDGPGLFGDPNRFD